MLGKIIKYDMKAMNRFLIIIHAFLLIYAFFIRILITGRLTANNVITWVYLLLNSWIDCFFWYYPAYLCCFCNLNYHCCAFL